MAKALQPVNVDGIEFDALIDESRTLEADSPEYPVETGFVVGDSIILKPQRLEMTLYLTNTPVTWKSRLGGDPNRIQTVIKKLEELYFSRKLITVATSEKTYRNMAVMSITIAKSRETGYAREIPIGFKEIRVTASATVTIPDSYGKSGSSDTNAGTANTTKSSSASSSSSGQSGSKGSILFGLASSSGLLGGRNYGEN